MSRPRALDLFCKAGGVSMGLYRAGFDVVGVDIEPQKNYPFKFVQADALEYPLAGYDFIWASPPRQAHTLAQRIRKNDHPDLVDPIRQRLKSAGALWSIENVLGAPLINPVLLCGCMFGLGTYRHRLVESSFYVRPPNHPAHDIPTTKMGRAPRAGQFLRRSQGP
jgi:DNA (cytosine-5)-methyltransferase 1